MQRHSAAPVGFDYEGCSVSRLSEVADAVTKDLNTAALASQFSLPFVAVRRYLPRFEVEELTEMKVSVVSAEKELSQAARTKYLQSDSKIDIGVHVRVNGTDPELVDPYANLLEEFAEYFHGIALTGVSDTLTGIDIRTPWSPQDMAKGMYVGIVRLNFLAVYTK